jgi:hypothetical protein
MKRFIITTRMSSSRWVKMTTDTRYAFHSSITWNIWYTTPMTVHYIYSRARWSPIQTLVPSLTTIKFRNISRTIYSVLLAKRNDHHIAGFWWDQKGQDRQFILILSSLQLGTRRYVVINAGSCSHSLFQRASWKGTNTSGRIHKTKPFNILHRFYLRSLIMSLANY